MLKLGTMNTTIVYPQVKRKMTAGEYQSSTAHKYINRRNGRETPGAMDTRREEPLERAAARSHATRDIFQMIKSKPLDPHTSTIEK